MIQQQTLPLKLITTKNFASFWVSDAHKQIVSALKKLPPSENIFLWGAPLSGLSHLAQACCDHWQKQGKHSLYLDLTNLEQYQNILPDALSGFEVIIFDHLESALQNAAHEELLFHCYNRLLHNKCSMVFLAHSPPDHLHCQLADLKSRLMACLVLKLSTITDEDKIQVLKLYAKQTGLSLSSPAARYLLTHYSRDLNQLLKLLDQLDAASLRDKKRLTIPFIKKQIAS